MNFTAFSTLKVYTLGINWLAVDDPRILVLYASSNQLASLMSGQGNRSTIIST